jgi:clorobiocin biosynthesis protein CloN4
VRLQDLVIGAAGRAPDSLAVASEEQAMTYRELDAAADRFARALRARGARPGDRAVLWSGKSALAVAFMQGALRAGVVYVPVTYSNPAERVGKIAADCAAVVTAADGSVTSPGDLDGVVALRDLLEEVPETGTPQADALTYDPSYDAATGDAATTQTGSIDTALIDTALIDTGLIDTGLTDAGSIDTASPDSTSAMDDPAYILYTSGSTGTPKGVCISHRAALAFVDWAAEIAGLGPEDRLSSHAPFNFDLSVFDLYAAFRAGASVHLVPPEMAYAPHQLLEFIRERRITVWYSVPSVLSLMMREAGLLEQPRPPALRVCIFAGEPFPTPQVQALRKAWSGVRMFNWYGPTETNVCTSYEVTDEDFNRTGPLPIGTASCGDTILLDPGPDEGELVVEGPTVMLGYWGREPHRGPYRTGDLARRGADGNLDYAGRIDHMVKLRGNRVELGEVEGAIAAHPAVAAVAALVLGSGLDSRLHAVVVPVDGRRPRLLELKLFCSKRLPTYMLLDTLHTVDALPLTPNGKTDRSALAAAIETGGLR